MLARYGQDWLMDSSAPLNAYAQTQIQEAIQEIPNGSHHDLVAELKFAFWVSLCGPPYDSSLWRQALYLGFLQGGGKPRNKVHGRLNAIRRFRNRVAHHEPVSSRAKPMYDEIIECIGWMCETTRQWTVHNSRFDQVHSN